MKRTVALATVASLALSACGQTYAPPPVTTVDIEAVRRERPAPVVPIERTEDETFDMLVRVRDRLEGAATEFCIETEAACPPFDLRIDPGHEPNAYAAIDGTVSITMPLVEVLEEDEIAVVLGHEYAHLVSDHPAENQATETAAVLIGSILLGVAAAALTEDADWATQQIAVGAGTAIGGLMGMAVAQSYSREQENEADYVGCYLAARAGYDPAACPRTLRALYSVVAAEEGLGVGGSAFSSHPDTAERVVRMSRTADEIEAKRRQGLTLTPETGRG